jgi:hypothetical protein
MIVLLPYSFSFLPHILSPYSCKLYGPLVACLTIEVEENCESIEGTWLFPDFEFVFFLLLNIAYVITGLMKTKLSSISLNISSMKIASQN